MVAAIVALQHKEVGTVLNLSHTDSTVIENREAVVLMSKKDYYKYVSLMSK